MDLIVIVKEHVLPHYGAVWLHLIPVLLLAVCARTAWFKGMFGECLVNFSARLFLPKSDYHLIRDVTLPSEGGTTQIDHIIVSRYGVFVVETKNIKGWIFGGARQQQWTQKIYRRSYKFHNPLHQNFKHVKTLQNLLALRDDQIHSVVVFVGDSTFKTPMPENVTYSGGYLRYIKSFKEPALDTGQVLAITRNIEDGRLAPGFRTDRDHFRHVQQIAARRNR
jgi:restriction system protein